MCCPVARKIPFDDPDVLNYARIGYLATQFIILGIYYYVSMTVRCTLCAREFTEYSAIQIKRKNDQTVLKYGEFTLIFFCFFWVSQAEIIVEPSTPMVCSFIKVKGTRVSLLLVWRRREISDDDRAGLRSC